jgi:hypothetical protein
MEQQTRELKVRRPLMQPSLSHYPVALKRIFVTLLTESKAFASAQRIADVRPFRCTQQLQTSFWIVRGKKTTSASPNLEFATHRAEGQLSIL